MENINNDKKFWTKSKKETIDEDFRFDKGIIEGRTKKWRKDAGKGTIKGHEKSIIIRMNIRLILKHLKNIKTKKMGYLNN